MSDKGSRERSKDNVKNEVEMVHADLTPFYFTVMKETYN